MTFNASCAFAGIANLLECFGIDKQDYELAIGMKLPYLFDYDEQNKTYLTGSALQTSDYFNLFLHSLGVEMQEISLSKNETIEKLKDLDRPVMIGITLDNDGKHAIIFRGCEGEKFCFTNNKRFDSEEPDEYVFSELELSSRLDETVIIGWLEECPVKVVDFKPYFEKSLTVLQQYREELLAFCETRQSIENLNAAKDRLFRPIALDGLAMMELISHTEMLMMQREVQEKFIAMLRKREMVIPMQELPLDLINRVIDEYLVLIGNE